MISFASGKHCSRGSTLLVATLCLRFLLVSSNVFTKLDDVTGYNCTGTISMSTSASVFKKTQCAAICDKDPECQAFTFNNVHGNCLKQRLSTRMSDSCTRDPGALHYGKLQSGCPNDFNWHGGARMCYKLSTTCGSWHEGREQCHLAGTDLLLLSDPEFRAFFVEVAKANVTGQCGTADGVWVGAAFLGEEAGWVWTDGTPVASGVWSPGQPGDEQDAAETCMDVYRRKGGGSFIINDAYCYYAKKHFACGLAM